MEKTLVFISDRSRMFFPYASNDKVHVENVWKADVKIKYKWIIKVIRKLHLPIGIFFEDWTSRVGDYSRIIIFDGCYDKLLMYYLNKYNKKANKFVFCWNAKYRLEHVFGTPYKTYSYSPNDCKECGYEYMSTVYSRNVILPNNPLQYDIVFLGLLKGRGDQLDQLYKSFIEANIKPMFYVVGKEATYKTMELQQKQLNYREYLHLISKSKAILDICNPGQDGLTMRMMESLFFRKKLITNNQHVIHYDFYRPENIFVLDNENIDDLKEFMNTDYMDISRVIIDAYDMSSWVEKFTQ